MATEERGLHLHFPLLSWLSESRPIPSREPSRRKEGSVVLLGAVTASASPRKEEGGILTISCQAIPRTEHLHPTS